MTETVLGSLLPCYWMVYNRYIDTWTCSETCNKNFINYKIDEQNLSFNNAYIFLHYFTLKQDVGLAIMSNAMYCMEAPYQVFSVTFQIMHKALISF